MKSACDFWLSRLKTATDGTLVAPNEYSPEHGPHEDGTSFAQQLIWDLFTNTIKASQVLNVDASYRSTLQTKLSQLDPGMHIGSWGQLREWKYTNDDPADTHRHQSYAICLYPGQQLLPLSRPDLAQAITVSLDHRGDGGDGGNGYGWDHAWKIALRARLFDGNHSYVLLQKLFTDGDFANNLFDIYGGSVFQIDANYGTMAGMAEMLLQSHAGFIHLLPALPDAWSTGSATGLCAQGAFVVGMNWSQKWITTATITSKLGGSCVVKNPLFQTGNFTLTANGSAVSYTLNGDTITFSTTAGTTYTITATGGAPTPTPTPVATPIPAGTNAVLNKTATANAYWDVQTPAKAVNGTILDTNDKWCTDQNPGAQWLKVDIGQTCNLNRWVVKHAGAGGETATLNTKDFKLQKSNDGTTWTDVDAVTGNTANITDRNVTAFSARYVQLYVTIPTQTTDVHSRIYEFEVYTVSGGATSTPTPTPAATATPTPTPAVTATPTPTSGIVSGATYKIIARHSGKLFGVNGGVTTNGATIVQQTDTSANSQKWVITDLGTGYYKIINLNSSKSLDINGGSTSDGAQAIQYTYSGSNNQQWQITDLGTGYFKILVRHSGKSLDVNGASTADGANIIQWTWSGSNNQQWQLVKQ